MKFCPNCGEELKPGARFCVACGTPIAAATPSPAQPAPQYQPDYQQQAPVYQQAYDTGQNTLSDSGTGTPNLLRRVINIIIKPHQEWIVITGEQPDVLKLVLRYALILALIPAISAFLRYVILGLSYGGFSSISFTLAIQTGLIQLLSALIGVCLLAWIIDILAPAFNSEKNFGRSFQLAVYSSTPQWIAGFLLLLPTGISMLVMFIGLYAIYLLAVGMPVMKGTPKDRLVGYVVLTIVAMIVIGLVLTVILGVIMALIFTGRLGVFGL